MFGKQVLVVDDEEDILELARFDLSKEGYRVTFGPQGFTLKPCGGWVIALKAQLFNRWKVWVLQGT